jgi:hypothetical protein
VITADRIIDSYVADVVTLLPRSQRRDVAQELRTLLRDEVDAAAGGPDTREEAARELLTSFGRPAEVAARYGSPVSLIDPADTRRFLILGLAGAVLIPFGAVLNAFVEPAHARRDLGRVVETAWFTVFAWLGLLVVGFGIAAWARRRRPAVGWKPRPMPTDRINRPGRAAAIAFFVLGTFALADPQWLLRKVSGGRATAAAYHAFAYDDAFLRLRGPVVLAVMVAGLMIQAILLYYGRWRPWTRQADMGYGLVVCAVLTWAIAAGPVFQAASTDRSVKGAAAVIVLVTLADLAMRSRRDHVHKAVEIGEPSAQRST